MYQRTLCATLPISIAIIIAGALFADGGDLNPPPGPVTPTMHTLDEIYGLVAAPQSCPPCTWEYWSGTVSGVQDVLAVPGSGILHAVLCRRIDADARTQIFNGPPTDGVLIADFGSTASDARFELDVHFEQGLHLHGLGSALGTVTLLYRSAK